MERALNKIADIISDMAMGIIDDDMAGFSEDICLHLTKMGKSQQVSVSCLLAFTTGLLQTKCLLQNRR